jgi:hypothetical protein
MLYSCMSPEQRKILLDNPESYPMRVCFLGKVGIMTREEMAFLLENGIDFDVDDRAAAEVLGPDAVRAAHLQASRMAQESASRTIGASQSSTRQSRAALPPQPESPMRREGHRIGSGCLLLLLNAAITVASVVLRRLTRR